MAIRALSAAAAIGVLLVGCATTSERFDVAPQEVQMGAWVVVIYDDTVEQFDVNVMDALFETEMAADAALQEAEAGLIDGNDIGQHQYQLYFIGSDATRMWEVLEPVFEDAPIHWTSVELRDGLEDPSPVVLTP